MVDFNKILSGLTQSGVAGGLAGGLAGGALASALGSKKGRKTAKTVLAAGGVAAVGGLAWKAYQNYQQGQQGAPQDQSPASWPQLMQSQFDIEQQDQQQQGSNSLLVIRAMITAAFSDGHIDATEQKRIFDQTSKLDLDSSEKAMLFDELTHPKSIRDIVVDAKEPALAVEVYAASLLAIDESTTQGQTYLERLAFFLELPEPLVRELHAQTMPALPAATG